MNFMPRKILVPIFNRAHLGRLRSVLKAVREHPELKLQVITAGPAAFSGFRTNLRHSRPRSWRLALPWYLRAKLLSFSPRKIKENDVLTRSVLDAGFSVEACVPFFLDGGVAETMAKSVGLGIVALVDELKRLKPDIVLVNADRFEMMAVAVAASYLNIPVAHNEGGDISGTIDEHVRHAITKLSHIHFAATGESRKRIIQMGENPDTVFTVGSPAIDVIKGLDTSFGGAGNIDVSKPYLLVLMHPVTTEKEENNILAARNLVAALEDLRIPTIFLGSNIDAGASHFGRVIKEWRLNKKPAHVYFAKHLAPDDFYNALSGAACAVGNSSSFIREGAYFGTPAVILGSRQQGRERGENVIEVGIEAEEIKKAIEKQLSHGRYPSDTRFGDGAAGAKIADILATVKPKIQKSFYEV